MGCDMTRSLPEKSRKLNFLKSFSEWRLQKFFLKINERTFIPGLFFLLLLNKAFKDFIQKLGKKLTFLRCSTTLTPSTETTISTGRFFIFLALNSYRTRRIAATISILEDGRIISMLPMYCKGKLNHFKWHFLLELLWKQTPEAAREETSLKLTFLACKLSTFKCSRKNIDENKNWLLSFIEWTPKNSLIFKRKWLPQRVARHTAKLNVLQNKR